MPDSERGETRVDRPHGPELILKHSKQPFFVSEDQTIFSVEIGTA